MGNVSARDRPPTRANRLGGTPTSVFEPREGSLAHRCEPKDNPNGLTKIVETCTTLVLWGQQKDSRQITLGAHCPNLAKRGAVHSLTRRGTLGPALRFKPRAGRVEGTFPHIVRELSTASVGPRFRGGAFSWHTSDFWKFKQNPRRRRSLDANCWRKTTERDRLADHIGPTKRRSFVAPIVFSPLAKTPRSIFNLSPVIDQDAVTCDTPGMPPTGTRVRQRKAQRISIA